MARCFVVFVFLIYSSITQSIERVCEYPKVYNTRDQWFGCRLTCSSKYCGDEGCEWKFEPTGGAVESILFIFTEFNTQAGCAWPATEDFVVAFASSDSSTVVEGPVCGPSLDPFIWEIPGDSARIEWITDNNQELAIGWACHMVVKPDCEITHPCICGSAVAGDTIYSNSFSGGILGTMTMGTSRDFDINVIDAAGTQSPNTGAPSAHEDTYYIHAEATAHTSETTSVEMLNIATTDYWDCLLTFYFYMIGTDCNKYEIYGKIGAAGYTLLATREGEQTASWTKDCVDLSTYDDQADVSFLIKAYMPTSGDLGDIAFDTFSVTGFQKGIDPEKCTLSVALPSQVTAGDSWNSVLQLYKYSGKKLTSSYGTITATSSGTDTLNIVDNADGTFSLSIDFLTSEEISIDIMLDGNRYNYTLLNTTVVPDALDISNSLYDAWATTGNCYIGTNITFTITPRDQYGNLINDNNANFEVYVEKAGNGEPMSPPFLNYTWEETSTPGIYSITYFSSVQYRYHIWVKSIAPAEVATFFDFYSTWICEPGSEGLQDVMGCVDCERGSFCDDYYDDDAIVYGCCEPCEQGTYYNETKSLNCTSCPVNATTLGTGNTNSSFCLCDEGFFGPHGGFNCTECSPGLACPIGTLYPECAEGYFLYASSCVVCPTGGYCAGGDVPAVPATGYYESSCCPPVFKIYTTNITLTNATGLDVQTTDVPVDLVINANDPTGNPRISSGDSFWVKLTNLGTGSSEIWVVTYSTMGKYIGSFDVTLVGTYQVDIMGCANCSYPTMNVTTPYAELEHIGHSPYTLTITHGIIHHKSTFYGLGAEYTIVNETSYFTIQSSDAYRNNVTVGGAANNFAVSIGPLSGSSPTATVLGIIDQNDGTYRVSYMPHAQGDLLLTVLYDGDNLSGRKNPTHVPVAAICSYGYFPELFVGPCLPCETGTYDHRSLTVLKPSLDFCLDETACPLFECTSCLGNRVTAAEGSVGLMKCICPEDSYGAHGASEDCIPCPNGGKCVQGATRPVAKPGYFRRPDNTFYKCVPPESCGVNNTCGVGYTGDLCILCVESRYRLNGKCVPCPTWSFFVIFAMMIGAILGVIGAMKLAQSGFNFGALVIFFNYAQILTYFSRVSGIWPDILIDIFNQLKVFNFNMDLLALPCAIDLSFWDLWLMKLSVPVLGFVMLFIADVCYFIFLYTKNLSITKKHLATKQVSKSEEKLAMLRQQESFVLRENSSRGHGTPGTAPGTAGEKKKKKKFDRAKSFKLEKKDSFKIKQDDIVGEDKNVVESEKPKEDPVWGPMGKMIDVSINSFVFLVTMQFAYLVITAMVFFKCIEQKDGSYTMEEQPDEECYTDVWWNHFPVAVVCLLVYGVGIPLTDSIILYKNRHNLSVPKFRRRFGGIYHRYRREMFMWEMMIMMRKLCIVVSFLYFTSHAIFQLIGSIATLFVALELHNSCRPFAMLLLLRLEYMSLCSSVVLLICGILFLGGMPTDQGYHVLTIVACIVVFTTLTVFAGAFLHQILHFTKLQMLSSRTKGDIDRRSLLDADFARTYLSEEELANLENADKVLLGGIGSVLHKSTHEARPAYEILQTAPPQGEICFGKLNIHFYDKKIDDKLSNQVDQVVKDVIRMLALMYKGYEVNFSRKESLFAFNDISQAITWSLEIQKVFLQADWPEDFLKILQYHSVYDIRNPDVLLWRGPRVSCVLQAGNVSFPIGSKPIYQGLPVDICNTLSESLTPGFVYITRDTWEALPVGDQEILKMEDLRMSEPKYFNIKINEDYDGMELYTANPVQLLGRLVALLGGEEFSAEDNEVIPTYDSIVGLDLIKLSRMNDEEMEELSKARRKNYNVEVLISAGFLIFFNIIVCVIEYLTGAHFGFVIFRSVAVAAHLMNLLFVALKSKHLNVVISVSSILRAICWSSSFYFASNAVVQSSFSYALLILFLLFTFNISALNFESASAAWVAAVFSYIGFLIGSRVEPMDLIVFGVLCCLIVFLGKMSLHLKHVALTNNVVLRRSAFQEKEKIDAIVDSMLPRRINMQLQKGITTVAEDFAFVTILFAKVSKFSEITEGLGADLVMGLLMRLFRGYDRLVSELGAFKVESVGDVYMVSAGVPEKDEDHAKIIGKLALKLLKQTSYFKSNIPNVNLRIQIGIHCGPVRAGCLGKVTFHYSLFGDTVNMASRMCSHGKPDCIHVSPVAAEQYAYMNFRLQKRGIVNIKGIGEIQTSWLVGLPTTEELTPQSVITEKDDISVTIFKDDVISNVTEISPFTLRFKSSIWEKEFSCDYLFLGFPVIRALSVVTFFAMVLFLIMEKNDLIVIILFSLCACLSLSLFIVGNIGKLNNYLEIFVAVTIFFASFCIDAVYIFNSDTAWDWGLQYRCLIAVISLVNVNLRMIFNIPISLITFVTTVVGSLLHNITWYQLTYRIIIIGMCLIVGNIASRIREKRERNQFILLRALEEDKIKSVKLLSSLIPRHTVQRILDGETGISEELDDVTIVQSDLVGFTTMSASLAPSELFFILSDLFSAFDVLVEKYKLFKAYTIGDAYVVIGGIQGTTRYHREASCNLALDMQEVLIGMNDGFQKKNGCQLKIRVGIASGNCSGGVLGLANPRYLLFGYCPEMADHLEQTSMPEKIHVSNSTVSPELLDKFEFEMRKVNKLASPSQISANRFQRRMSINPPMNPMTATLPGVAVPQFVPDQEDCVAVSHTYWLNRRNPGYVPPVTSNTEDLVIELLSESRSAEKKTREKTHEVLKVTPISPRNSRDRSGSSTIADEIEMNLRIRAPSVLEPPDFSFDDDDDDGGITNHPFLIPEVDEKFD